MFSATTKKQCSCSHVDENEARGLALITLTAACAGKKKFVSAILSALPQAVLKDVCCFNLSAPEDGLVECLTGHRAAIIIDACISEGETPNVFMIDMGALLERRVHPRNEILNQFQTQSQAQLQCLSQAESAIADELRPARNKPGFPRRIILLNISAAAQRTSGKGTGRSYAIGAEQVKTASSCAARIIDTLKRSASSTEQPRAAAG